MKAISLWQPWATLVAIGAKRIETRSWRTSYRGTLAIHAAKKKVAIDFYLNLLPKAGISYFNSIIAAAQLPFGKVIATCDLVGCMMVEKQTLWPHGHIDDDFKIPPDEPERSFGDYTPGRYAWFLKNIRPLRPFAWHRSQGFFDVPDAMISDYALPTAEMIGGKK